MLTRSATEEPAPVNIKKAKTPKPILKNPAPASKPAAKITKKTTSEVTPDVTKPEPKKVAKAAKEAKAAVEKAEKPKADANGVKPAKNAKVSTKQTATKKSKLKVEKVPVAIEGELDSGLEDEDEEMNDDSEVDDQTQALLDGLESDGDDEDAEVGGAFEGGPVPERKKLSKKEEKDLKKAAEDKAAEEPGVIYIGRLPHGFYENEMRAYFKQFGNILKLRMSRNKKTGASRHYAWCQFESGIVADIVARTMDNYLMFGHLLKVKLIPKEQVNEAWFKGANKRFKKVPWNKMAGRALEQGSSEALWDERVVREQQRREKKSKKMAEIGYDFKAPTVTSAKGVAKPKPVEEAVNGDSEALATETAPAAPEPTKSKKKGKKAKAEAVVSAPEATPAEKKEHRAAAIPPTVEDVEESIAALIAESADQPPKKKAKKTKATKTTDEPLVVVEEVLTVADLSKPAAKTTKKAKKTKAEVATEIVVPEVAVAAPEKKLKTKKSKDVLVEEATPAEASKKSKKRKASD